MRMRGCLILMFAMCCCYASIASAQPVVAEIPRSAVAVPEPPPLLLIGLGCVYLLRRNPRRAMR
ncbi:MAG: hypothetical protein QOE14_475 [Humisphaera sp.]|nr:hypothetical protein [Humisphaera sp.]